MEKITATFLRLAKGFGNVISEQIINEIKVGKFFAMITDKAADSSHREQMALILHFDKSINIREDFISFLQCKWGLSVENLGKLLLDELNKLGLPIDNCREQGYDALVPEAAWLC